MIVMILVLALITCFIYIVSGGKKKVSDWDNWERAWPIKIGSERNDYHTGSEQELNSILNEEEIFFYEQTDIGKFWITSNNLISKINNQIRIMNKFSVWPEALILWSKNDKYFRTIDCEKERSRSGIGKDIDWTDYLIKMNPLNLCLDCKYRDKYTIGFYSSLNSRSKDLENCELERKVTLYGSNEKDYSNPDWNTVVFCNISDPYEVYKALIKE